MNKTKQAMDADAMQGAAMQACALLKVLANPDRMMLLCQLSQGEHCVADLASALGIGQPTLSQQLAVLRDEKLVRTRREGKQIFYGIASAEALAVLQLMYALYCPATKESRDDRLE
ncbi:MAG: metalloregulator ArsR/SmtB family transcription factor [Pseudomonadota bacterium]